MEAVSLCPRRAYVRRAAVHTHVAWASSRLALWSCAGRSACRSCFGFQQVAPAAGGLTWQPSTFLQVKCLFLCSLCTTVSFFSSSHREFFESKYGFLYSYSPTHGTSQMRSTDEYTVIHTYVIHVIHTPSVWTHSGWTDGLLLKPKPLCLTLPPVPSLA